MSPGLLSNNKNGVPNFHSNQVDNMLNQMNTFKSNDIFSNFKKAPQTRIHETLLLNDFRIEDEKDKQERLGMLTVLKNGMDIVHN
jgi:GH35 family endo-1,4-beta-xylanase